MKNNYMTCKKINTTSIILVILLIMTLCKPCINKITVISPEELITIFEGKLD